MNITENKLRIGNPTSSEIVALTTLDRSGKNPGKPFFTYVEEKNMERRLDRSLDSESNARPLVWGKLLEGQVFDVLGLEYSLNSQETMRHEEIEYWCGSPDGFKYDAGKTVMDIKSPLTLKSFCQLVQPLYDGLTGMDAMNKIRETHKDGEKYFWQLVSNACISNSKFAELIVYVPYESELPEIKLMADGVDHCMWIQFAGENDLPFLKDGGYYKNLNIIRFEVPQEDKDFLTERVKLAGTMLIQTPSLILATHDEEVSATIIEPINILSKLKKIS
jgi:hypothetical protein